VIRQRPLARNWISAGIGSGQASRPSASQWAW